MQLLYSPTSPYARKLRVIIAELGLDVDLAAVAPMDDPSALTAANPLTKVPALVVDDGSIFDSPVIAAYLLSLRPGQMLLPAAGPAHWQGRTIEALADGILDAAITLRFDAAMGGSGRSPVWTDRLHRAIDGAARALPGRLEAYVKLAGGDFSYAGACAVIAAEYLDFRFPDIDWRAASPGLAAVVERWHARPSLAGTRPA